MTIEINKKARLPIIGLACIGVLMSFFTLSSSDLIRYDRGSFGLTKYRDERTGGSIAFLESEDPGLEAGRKAALFAAKLGLFYLLVLSYNIFEGNAFSNFLLIVLGTVIQLSLAVVYIAKENGICELVECSWGSGVIWLYMSEIIMFVSSIGALFTSEDPWVGKKKKVILDTFYPRIQAEKN
mmetsp:Transcript_14654/g.34061  ORF Transcript_14654/g.34061 Transcript_14654/m.34061 type:complete len:182 (-) Transcript_14654:99-644(-)